MTIEEIKNIYKNLLELNFRINSALNNFPKSDFDNFNEEFQQLLSLKSQSIERLTSLVKDSEEFERLKETDLKETIDQIQNFENENIKLIKEKQAGLSQEINKANHSIKALSGYKFNKEIKPRIIDEKE